MNYAERMNSDPLRSSQGQKNTAVTFIIIGREAVLLSIKSVHSLMNYSVRKVRENEQTGQNGE